MISSVRIRNTGSIGDAFLSFEKAGYKYLDEYVLDNKVANPIAIYGFNGSGKSSFLNAFDSLVNLLDEEPDKITGFIPNLVALQSNQKTVAGITLNFRLNDRDYEYSIDEDSEGLKSENLIIDGKTILKRSRNQYTYRNKTVPIEARLYPALRDLAAKRETTKDVTSAFEFLSNIAYVSANRKNYTAKSFKNKQYLDVLVEKSAQVKGILKHYKAFPQYDFVSQSNPAEKKQYYAELKIGDSKLRLPYQLASDGMLNQSFLLSVVLSLPENGVLVVDEIDQALHPLTTMDFINVAIEKRIQLIFSGHNTNLLSRLRPDNIVFANWKDGYSSFKRLSDIYPNIREVNNIEKMYLASTFDDAIKG